MPPQHKSDTARANGAKSNGPVTAQGRAISSRNSLRHGLTAKAVVLEGESREEFQSLFDAYIDQFQPATGVEADLVQTLAVTRWRLNRITGIETNIFGNEIALHAAHIDSQLTNMQPDDHLAWVFRHLADCGGKDLALILRYEGTLTRTYERAFKQFWPDRLYNFDGENRAEIVMMGKTDHGEEVWLSRRAAESDLVIYLNINLVPMDTLGLPCPHSRHAIGRGILMEHLPAKIVGHRSERPAKALEP